MNDKHLEEPGWYAVIKLLHENGARFSPKAFMAACEGGFEAAVKLMFDEGLDFTPDAKFYTDALEKADKGERDVLISGGLTEATKRGYKAIMSLLREKIAGQSG